MPRLQDIKMKPKLIGLFLLIGIIPMALGGWWALKSPESHARSSEIHHHQGSSESQTGNLNDKFKFR